CICVLCTMQVKKMKNNEYAPKETGLHNVTATEGDKLTKRYDLVEEMNFLFVRIIRVRDFPYNPNLYVEVKLGNMKATTIFLDNNLLLNQVFAFEKDKVHSTKVDVMVRDKIEVMDMSREFIGRVLFEVGDIPKRVPPESTLAPQWYRLEDQNGVNLAGGAIMLSLWIGTQADEYFPHAWCSDSTRISGDAVGYTRSKVYMSPTLWYLRVNVIQAHDLLLRFDPKCSDIFVQVDLGSLRLRTSFSKIKSEKPVWNEELMFVAHEPFDERIFLSVEQGTLVDHVSLGTYMINLKDVEKRLEPIPVESLWYDLNRPGVIETANEVKFASKLNAEISLDGGYHVMDEPLEYSSDFRPSSKKLWKPSIGVLELGILKATGLIPMKIGGRTDAYCVAKYGPKWVRTRTIVDSLSPNWNEQYVWEVNEPFTVITIAVFDNNQLYAESRGRGVRDTIMAKIRIRVSTLARGKVYTHSYPLVGLQPSGMNKMGEIHLAVRFSWPLQAWSLRAWLNMYQIYKSPLFNDIHYFLPLSSSQLDNLRNQAAHVIARSLSKAEPPLGKEVVTYMLEMRSDLWSMRKGLANYNRIMSFLGGFVVFWKWLEDIKKWENPTATLLFHFLCILVVLHPQPMLSLVIFYLFWIGFKNFFNRPKHPCHIDETLSGADTTNAEDLEEELDFFPTQIGGEHLRRRYDRLRIIARNAQRKVSYLATIGEKVESLCSWRDPRATTLFFIFCVAGLVVTMILPLQVIIFIWIMFYLRHPRYRSGGTWSAESFFKRLPSNQAFIL
ncbi:FT-interacting protein 7-like, partial [Vicia villosa]|uniref:FT-interacting protein 7-like n=1 Tax=Vicia villosa TaxID=3911 RepID=UPI00273C2FF0